jgi:fructose-specific phosphotransferase system IIC component
MRESFTLDQIRRFALFVVLVGVVIGISGAVRTGSIIISLSASIFVLARYSQSQVKRGIELVLPITICALLFILALSLPDAR